MSIKQAIEALESCDPGDYSTGHVIHPSYDEEKVNAALAALRSMPQGEPVPVPNSIPLRDYLTERIASMTPEQLAQFEAARVRIKQALATLPRGTCRFFWTASGIRRTASRGLCTMAHGLHIRSTTSTAFPTTTESKTCEMCPAR